MHMNKLDDKVTVSPQIAVTDVAEIEAAAKEAGLKTYFLQVQSRPEAESAAEGFAAAMDENDQLFAYCRSGTRCQLIYQAAKARA